MSDYKEIRQLVNPLNRQTFFGISVIFAYAHEKKIERMTNVRNIAR